MYLILKRILTLVNYCLQIGNDGGRCSSAYISILNAVGDDEESVITALDVSNFKYTVLNG